MPRLSRPSFQATIIIGLPFRSLFFPPILTNATFSTGPLGEDLTIWTMFLSSLFLVVNIFYAPVVVSGYLSCPWVYAFSRYSTNLMNLNLLVGHRKEHASDDSLVIAWASVICCPFLSGITMWGYHLPMIGLPLPYWSLMSLHFVLQRQCFFIICDSRAPTCPCLACVCAGTSCSCVWNEDSIF